jgi:MFS family permease
MLGALGAVAGTTPAEAAVAWLGWRPIFILLAVATAAAAAVILLVVPEPTSKPEAPRRRAGGYRTLLDGFATIYCDPRFLRLAPLSASCAGTAWAMQGLWAAPWLADVEGLAHQGVVRHLLVMGLALSGGALLLGLAGRQLSRRGVPLSTLLGATAGLFIVAQLGLIFRVPISSYLLWGIVAAVGAITVLSYAIVSEAFPPTMTGRANGSLNLLHMSTAFVVQTGLGIIIARWPELPGGHYPAAAYRDAFLANCLLQVAALAWFAWPLRSRRPAAAPLSYDRIAGKGT